MRLINRVVKPTIQPKSNIQSFPNVLTLNDVLDTPKKYRVHLVYDTPNWAYYNDCNSIGKRAPSDFLVTASTKFTDVVRCKSDLCLLCYYQQTSAFNEFAKQNNIKTKLISQYTVGWGFHDNEYLYDVIKQNPKHVVINNFGAWDKLGRLPGTLYIPNGVERELFKFKTPITHRPVKVVYIGSKIHSPIKNYDRILVPLRKRLEDVGIECDFRCVNSQNPKEFFSRTQLAEWYNNASIYVVASSYEGTPNPGLESSSCGCTVVSTRCGNMPELIKDGWNGYLCDCSVDSLFDGCMKAVKNRKVLQYNMQTEIAKWDWKYSAAAYYEYFRKVINDE